MYIVHIASELAPVAKVGGLGDVVHGLSQQQSNHDHKVEVILPKYDIIDSSGLDNLHIEMSNLVSYEHTDEYSNTIWKADLQNVSCFFIETNHELNYFNRGKIYGEVDDVDRFLYFSRTCLEYLYKSGKKPDIIHIHDWHTSAVSILAKEMYNHLEYIAKGIVLTIHNLSHQGICSTHNLSRIGLRGEDFLTEERLQDPHKKTRLNLLKGGIQYSDAIVPVSPSYAKEILTKDGGSGLDHVLKEHEDKLHGILNGIDTQVWDPSTDPYLPHRYPTLAHKTRKIFKTKKKIRKSLQLRLGLKNSKGPLITCITRLVPQKSPSLIKDAIKYTIEKGGQFALLGSTSDPSLEREFVNLKKAYGHTKDLFIQLKFDESLAHQIYAAADAIVVPSLFEPCGLTQLIAMRYATLPLVRKTGGLADTVFDLIQSKKSITKRNGFCFEGMSPEALKEALDRLFEIYIYDKARWRMAMANGLNQDLSWDHSAKAYEKHYKKVLLRTTASRPSFSHKKSVGVKVLQT